MTRTTHSTPPPQDRLGRSVRDLRISVTDRCNFRCTYCMPKEIFSAEHQFLQRGDLLSFEEIVRVVTLFAGLGVKKIRLTGGEPLLRRRIEALTENIARVEGIADLSLTTNGSLLSADRARALKDAGLSRITVSLDSLDEDVFARLNDVGFPVAKVLQGIDNALRAGFRPVKVNMVVKKGVNDDQVLPMAQRFRGSDCILRFIEYMDVGHSNQWKLGEVLPAADIVAAVNREFPIEPAERNYRGEVAKRWRYLDGCGEIGIIASVTQPFCRDCTRVRMSAEGQLYTCLFATIGHDIRHLLREHHSDEFITRWLRDLWRQRSDRYSEQRNPETRQLPKVEMSYIGG